MIETDEGKIRSCALDVQLDSSSVFRSIFGGNARIATPEKAKNKPNRFQVDIAKCLRPCVCSHKTMKAYHEQPERVCSSMLENWKPWIIVISDVHQMTFDFLEMLLGTMHNYADTQLSPISKNRLLFCFDFIYQLRKQWSEFAPLSLRRESLDQTQTHPFSPYHDVMSCKIHQVKRFWSRLK